MGNLHKKRRKQRQRGRRMAEDAWNAVERSDLDKAEEILRQAIRGRAGDCVLWNDLGLVLWKLRKLREAEKAFRDALVLRPTYEEAKMNLSSLLASRGFYRQALRLEEEMAASSPRAGFHQKRIEEYRAAAERKSTEAEAGMEPGEEGADPDEEAS
ncbi:MAG TPA: tetratricopeptide repeat protein [Planctomycetota bacterium]|nr:tetratricopeptide repeat protein [Planctomycetota bacterium]